MLAKKLHSKLGRPKSLSPKLLMLLTPSFKNLTRGTYERHLMLPRFYWKSHVVLLLRGKLSEISQRMLKWIKIIQFWTQHSLQAAKSIVSAQNTGAPKWTTYLTTLTSSASQSESQAAPKICICYQVGLWLPYTLAFKSKQVSCTICANNLDLVLYLCSAKKRKPKRPDLSDANQHRKLIGRLSIEIIINHLDFVTRSSYVCTLDCFIL